MNCISHFLAHLKTVVAIASSVESSAVSFTCLAEEPSSLTDARIATESVWEVFMRVLQPVLDGLYVNVPTFIFAAVHRQYSLGYLFPNYILIRLDFWWALFTASLHAYPEFYLINKKPNFWHYLAPMYYTPMRIPSSPGFKEIDCTKVLCTLTDNISENDWFRSPASSVLFRNGCRTKACSQIGEGTAITDVDVIRFRMCVVRLVYGA